MSNGNQALEKYEGSYDRRINQTRTNILRYENNLEQKQYSETMKRSCNIGLVKVDKKKAEDDKRKKVEDWGGSGLFLEIST